MGNITPITMPVTAGDGSPQNLPVPPPYLAPVQVNFASGYPQQLVAATPGSLTRLYRVFLVADGATTLTFCDGAAVCFTWKAEAPGDTLTLDPGIWAWAQGSLDTAFNLNSSNNVQITGTVWTNLNPD